MPDVSQVIKSFQEAYPVQTLTPSQALGALVNIRAAAVEVRQEALKQAINPANLPTAQGICQAEVERMSGVIRRIDEVYMPHLEGLAADPATDTPGAGALTTVFFNAGPQTDPDTGETFTTPEYLAPAMAANACQAAELTMIEAYQDLGEDIKKGAQEAAEKAKTAIAVGLPLGFIALGIGAFLAVRKT